MSANFVGADQGQDVVRRPKRPRPVNPNKVLAELYALLEEYSPRWYEEKQRDRALAALQLPKKVLPELVALLEDYAPVWYKEEQRDRALAALRVLATVKWSETSTSGQ